MFESPWGRQEECQSGLFSRNEKTSSVGRHWPPVYRQAGVSNPAPLRNITIINLEGWQNGYCAGPENQWEQSLAGSNPAPSAKRSGANPPSSAIRIQSSTPGVGVLGWLV